MQTKHQMSLESKSFNKIKDGSKNLELRLNDEKRQLIQVGDEIEFSLANQDVDNSKDKILTRVEDLYHFPTFKDLFYSFDPIEYGSEIPEEYTKMYEYYSREDELKYGALAIRIKIGNSPVVRIRHNRIPTQKARELKDALLKRGVKVYVELHDGFKTVDLAIPNAKINIEVDGVHHLTNTKQILADLNRGYYSHKNGYDTMHIQNETIEKHLDKIADALAEAAKIRQEKIFVNLV